ncbi:MAG: hypothetical protein OXE87_15345 [Chloroflexi bacterium]|nr:hypothetical protein [Chloroflexota bacterium]
MDEVVGFWIPASAGMTVWVVGDGWDLETMMVRRERWWCERMRVALVGGRFEWRRVRE